MPLYNFKPLFLCLAIFLVICIFRVAPDRLSGRSTLWQTQKELRAGGQSFPKRVWQAYGLVGDGKGIEKWSEKIQTWRLVNPDWQYSLLNNETATGFVEEHYRQRPSIVRFWHELGPTILRADFLRYLVILAEGGIYSDVDTSSVQPLSGIVPRYTHPEHINAVVGIEYDDDTYPLFVRPICFTQWTLMAKPGHPIFEKAVNRFMGNMEFLARLKGQELHELQVEKKEVLQGTGPGMFTDAVMETLREQTGRRLDWETFHNQTEPKLFGDVLVLPINGFGSGQKHSRSSHPEYGEVFVRHHFGKSWYKHN